MWITKLFRRPMVTLAWQGFSLSQNHSCADYIFLYEVRVDEKGRLLLTGECRNNGETFVEEHGIRLKSKTVRVLQSLALERLPTETQQEAPPEMVLDDTTTGFTLYLPDGTWDNKAIPSEMFEDIADRLKVYLTK